MARVSKQCQHRVGYNYLFQLMGAQMAACDDDDAVLLIVVHIACRGTSEDQADLIE